MPSTIAPVNASGSGTPISMSHAASMPAAAMTEPTDRSNPPLMMTIVSPTEAMPTIAIARPMFSRFVDEKKYGEKMLRPMNSIASAARRPGLTPNGRLSRALVNQGRMPSAIGAPGANAGPAPWPLMPALPAPRS